MNGDTARERVEVSVLGPVALRVDGVDTPPGGARPRALLGVLACARGDVVSADALVDAVWGHDAVQLSRGTLHVHVHNLRTRLGRHGQCVQSVAAGYRLAGPALTLDLDVVDDLVRRATSAMRAGDPVSASAVLSSALELWRGPAVCADLPELPVESVRTRYAHLRQEALSALFDAELAAPAAPPDLVPRIEGALREQPLSERMWGQLMVALHAAGRPADALAAYRRARAVLAEEAGLDPGEELRRLERAALDGRSLREVLQPVRQATTPSLLWRDGSGRARSYALPADRPVVLGRDRGAAVSLAHDALVSRLHVEIAAHPGGWTVRDLGSLNGTRLNGRRLDRAAPLAAGDVLQVGGTSLLVAPVAAEGTLASLSATRPAEPPAARD